MKKIFLILLLLSLFSISKAQENIEKGDQFPTGYIKATNPYHFATLDGVLYVYLGGQPFILVKYPPNDIRESFTIPTTVSRIAQGAFKGAKNLKELIIPQSVAYIGDNAFDDSGIEEFTISVSTSMYSMAEEGDEGVVYYDISGRVLDNPVQGVNIVSEKGVTKKVLIK